MAKYIIKLTPVESYFFGGENTFRFDEDGIKKSDYFIKSLRVPPAPSVIGMLRYVLLEQSGALKTDGKYLPEEQQKMQEFIGEKGYDVTAEKNEFGKIKSVSPLFIMDSEGNKYIQTPFNHRTRRKDVYTPIEMSGETVVTSEGEIHIPKLKEFDAKNPVGEMYMNISTGELAEDLILSEEKSSLTVVNGEEKVFKKSYCRLKPGYSFAVAAEIDYEIKDTVCYMGREKSAFLLKVIPCEPDYELETEIEGNFDGSIYYALSDLILKNKISYTDYAMVRIDSIRMISTSYERGSLKLTVRPKSYNMIKAGSVFTAKPDENDFYKDGFGLNKIIKLGGLKNDSKSI